MPTRFNPQSFTIGFCLLGLGVVWTLGTLGHVDAWSLLRTWWPTSLVVWGIAEIVATIQSRLHRRSHGEPR